MLLITPEMISERIRARRKALDLKQTEVAKLCDVSRATVSDWEKGLFKPKERDLLAKVLKTSVEWLNTGKGNPNLPTLNILKARQQEIHSAMVPLISWVQAGYWCDSVSYQNNQDEFTQWYPCPEKHSPSTYALQVKGESMADDYINGEIIYVDPEVTAENGYCVVVRQNSDAETTFKQLILDGSKKYLKALNPDWPNPIIEMLPDAVICGVVVGSYRKRN